MEVSQPVAMLQHMGHLWAGGGGDRTRQALQIKTLSQRSGQLLAANRRMPGRPSWDTLKMRHSTSDVGRPHHRLHLSPGSSVCPSTNPNHGASKSLHGHPIAPTIAKDWDSKTSASTRARFNNIGFDADLSNVDKLLSDLRDRLRARKFDGLLVGWCLRGYTERTEVFEKVVEVCVEEGRGAKLMFSTGPENLAETVLRNFPETA